MVTEQWGLYVITGVDQYKVSLPITVNRCLAGVVSDHGMARYAFGFSPDDLIIYGPGTTSDTRCHVIIIGGSVNSGETLQTLQDNRM